MGFLSALFSTAKWNDDPYQKRLAGMILGGAVYNASHCMEGQEINIGEVLALTKEAGWSQKEAADRFVHALSMIKPAADARTYDAAKDIAMNLYNAYTY